MEKQQESEAAGEDQAAPKAKKTKEQKSAPQQKRQLAFVVPNLSEPEMIKSLSPLKAITVYTASRALGVSASVASGVLRDLEEKKLLRRAGGFSGHAIWALPQKG